MFQNTTKLSFHVRAFIFTLVSHDFDQKKVEDKRLQYENASQNPNGIKYQVIDAKMSLVRAEYSAELSKATMFAARIRCTLDEVAAAEAAAQKMIKWEAEDII